MARFEEIMAMLGKKWHCSNPRCLETALLERSEGPRALETGPRAQGPRARAHGGRTVGGPRANGPGPKGPGPKGPGPEIRQSI